MPGCPDAWKSWVRPADECNRKEKASMTSQSAIQKRWFYALLGVVILLFAGIVYAWSVLAAPIRNTPIGPKRSSASPLRLS